MTEVPGSLLHRKDTDSLPRFLGSLDLTALAEQSAVTPRITSDSTDGSLLIQANGLELRVYLTHVDYYADARQVIVCVGAARLEGTEAILDARALAEMDLLTRYSSHSPQLRGRFSIVAIDLVEHRALLITDRFAVHPICYLTRGARLAFSDRADAVLPAGQRAIDPQAIFDYLYFHIIPAPRTIYRDVRRLEPARAAVFDRTGLHIEVTWKPRFEQPDTRTIRELGQSFRPVLDQAVEREVERGPVGCFLSGGTDSSTIAGLLSRRTAQAVPTFSIGFDVAGYDEMQYARIAARHFGTQHHEHYMSPAELMLAIPRIAAHYDQPFGNSSTAPAMVCALLARQAGVKKMLAGDGGDELFGGNTRYRKQKVFEAYFALPALLRRCIIEQSLLRFPLARRIPWLKKAASYVEQALLPMPERTESYNLLNRLDPVDLFSPELLDAVDMAAPATFQRDVYMNTDAIDIVDRMLCYDWRFTLSDNDLPKVAGATQIAGVAAGFPLLDDDLVDFAIGLPPSMKVRGLTLRYFFKRALRGVLPVEILRKRKHGFGLPIGAWLQTDQALRQMARASLQQLVGRRVLKADAVGVIIDTLLQQHAGFYGELVWILMMLEHWLAVHAPSFSFDAGNPKSN